MEEILLKDEKLPTSPSSVGYRRLADYMAWNPHAAIFQRFQAANMLNLLDLQAEIENLQDELIKVTTADKDQGNSGWEELQTSWAALHKGHSGQKELIIKLRKALNEYNTALVQQITIGNQPTPSPRDIGELCDWIQDPYGLASDLLGPGCRLWFSKQNGQFRIADKLILSQGSEGRDGFTQLLVRGLSKIAWILPNSRVQTRTFPAYPRLYPNQSPQRDFERISSTGAIIRAGDKITTVISCLVITIPVVILNYVTNPDLRIGLIVLFTLVFSLVLSFMSDAKRKEIFAAAAAFVAVQVVFVGTGGNVSG